MADMKIAENVEPLKKWDKLVKRNANGRFERGSKALAGAGRPPGSLNKTTTQLREAILGALEAAGGKEGANQRRPAIHHLHRQEIDRRNHQGAGQRGNEAHDNRRHANTPGK